MLKEMCFSIRSVRISFTYKKRRKPNPTGYAVRKSRDTDANTAAKIIRN